MSSQYRGRRGYSSCPPLTIYSSRVRRSQPRNVWGPLLLVVLLFILPALFVPGGAEESIRAIREGAVATLAPPTSPTDAIAEPMPSTIAAPPMVELMGPPAPSVAQVMGPPAPTTPVETEVPAVVSADVSKTEESQPSVTAAKKPKPRASTTHARRASHRATKVTPKASAPAPAPVVETPKEPEQSHALSRRIL